MNLFDRPEAHRQIAELEAQTEQPDFWKDKQASQALIQKLNQLKSPLEQLKSLSSQESDLQALFELLAESPEEDSLAQELSQALKAFTKQVQSLDQKLLLSGKYDFNSALFTINAGAGGTDAQDWAEILLRMYKRWMENRGFEIEILELSMGEEAGIKGVTLSVKGEYAYGLLKAERGIHRLVRISPFNANGKRQTSFASVEVIPEIEADLTVQIRTEDLRVDTFRASGAGGQHINKTDSAVRITHIPTGIVVACQTQRSQIQNRETAMRMLSARLMQMMEEQHAQHLSELRGDLKDNAWGHQIRSYVFHPYQMVKDHRTEFESNRLQEVLDGDLDPFIEAMLRKKDGV